MSEPHYSVSTLVAEKTNLCVHKYAMTRGIVNIFVIPGVTLEQCLKRQQTTSQREAKKKKIKRQGWAERRMKWWRDEGMDGWLEVEGLEGVACIGSKIIVRGSHYAHIV